MPGLIAKIPYALAVTAGIILVAAGVIGFTALLIGWWVDRTYGRGL